ncbi:murein L,D-transpeptidase catalytic domain-containing protein [Sphingomonas tabacisoli]|uniref:Murein L,D-transpeptidase catalytic domain-containing protein n=1 Tax=Sphingomonas tabacisoli TaxID=2249466 RepID=A0ABW4I5P7_9SPHN
MLITRRGLIGSVAAMAAMPAFAPVSALAAPCGPIVDAARRALAIHGAAAGARDVVGVADFSHASSDRRFHLVDMSNGRVSSFLVAHGRGSDPEHSGWLKRFSNDEGSSATSAGVYLTAGEYQGKHGRSMRLKGLDATNNNAEPRAVVVHGAWYVSPQILAEHGKLGRSEGCFAFSEIDLPGVLEQLGPGRLITAGKFS